MLQAMGVRNRILEALAVTLWLGGLGLYPGSAVFVRGGESP